MPKTRRHPVYLFQDRKAGNPHNREAETKQWFHLINRLIKLSDPSIFDELPVNVNHWLYHGLFCFVFPTFPNFITHISEGFLSIWAGLPAKFKRSNLTDVAKYEVPPNTPRTTRKTTRITQNCSFPFTVMVDKQPSSCVSCSRLDLARALTCCKMPPRLQYPQCLRNRLRVYKKAPAL